MSLYAPLVPVGSALNVCGSCGVPYRKPAPKPDLPYPYDRHCRTPELHAEVAA